MIVLSGVILFWIVTIVYGKNGRFHRTTSTKQLSALSPVYDCSDGCHLYFSALAVHDFFKNQAIPFFVGVTGEFVGLFSMFLPQFPVLRKAVLWGYYGALQFVGLFGWDKETRYDHAYFAVLPLDWPAFALLIGLMILTYVIGKIHF